MTMSGMPAGSVARVGLLGARLPAFQVESTSTPVASPSVSLPTDAFGITGLDTLLKRLEEPAVPTAPETRPPATQLPGETEQPTAQPRSTVAVRPGDTLSIIAARELGDAGRWKDIFEANRDRLADPNLITPGEILRLPGGEKAPAPKPAAPTPASAPTASKQGQLPNPASYFMNQMYTPNNPDAPAWTLNCGPAALAMAARAFGQPFAGRTVQQQIDSSLLASTGKKDYYAGTWPDQLMRGARAAGLSTYGVPSTLAAVDAALAKGQMVVAWGYPRYAANFGPSQYHYAYGAPYNGGHYILVTGKTGDGRYLINDSLSKMGPLTISRDQLANYMNFPRNGDLIWSVVVGP